MPFNNVEPETESCKTEQWKLLFEFGETPFLSVV